MRNPTPAPIIVPVSGAPTCRGITLTVRDLSEWSRDADMGKDDDMVVLACAKRAERDGAVLCLRPTAEGKGACIGMTPTAFAVASLADDFAARALVVDPYDRDGNDLREVLPMRVPFNPEIRAGERVCDIESNEYRVVSAKHMGGINVEYTTDLILCPVEQMTSTDLAAREDAAVAVWEGSERV